MKYDSQFSAHQGEYILVELKARSTSSGLQLCSVYCAQTVTTLTEKLHIARLFVLFVFG